MLSPFGLKPPATTAAIVSQFCDRYSGQHYDNPNSHMFEVTEHDIEKLDDKQLRELVARCAQAEAQAQGYSALHITWGGSQTAPDGGLDVKASLPTNLLCPAMPRAMTGYQVKKPDMSAGKIIEEMRPNDVLRDIFPVLAGAGGAYLIVSSTGTLSEKYLDARRQAMRKALDDCPQKEKLHTDFLDRRRLTDWVNRHPGPVLWVREQAGRSIPGWRPMGTWSNPTEQENADYLSDSQIRIRLGNGDNTPVTAEAAISRMRELLSRPRSCLRLVGLSGVGKTRLVQALFDTRIGHHVLPNAYAVYTDLSYNPTPQPVAMATDLLAQGQRAILIVDNCGSDLHKRLSEQCVAPSSTLNLITIEYDVREDLKEHTHVITIEPSSDSLVVALLRRRYPHVAPSNAHHIALASGGNARIALAIAATVNEDENLAGLKDNELFERLFRQRHEYDRDLLRAAQVCALVYSFDGVTEDGLDAELPMLASLSGCEIADLFESINVLRERELLQARGQWRAVLPHALANFLAGKALNSLLPSRISLFLANAPHRLLLSFSRRLSYLHDHPKAIEICEQWLRPDGMLAHVVGLTPQQQKIFENVAPVAPADTLAALERAASTSEAEALATWYRFMDIIRLIAYDDDLFDRCVSMLGRLVQSKDQNYRSDAATKVLVSFCQPASSGTLASIERRIELMGRWLNHVDPKVQNLARLALTQALSTRPTRNFMFAFGSRARSDAISTPSIKQHVAWFEAALDLLRPTLAFETIHSDFSRKLLASQLRWLWEYSQLRDRLETLMLASRRKDFWREGWQGCRDALRHHSFDPEGTRRAKALEIELAPNTLANRILAHVMQGTSTIPQQRDGEKWEAYTQRIEHEVFELGAKASADNGVLAEVLPQLLRTSGRGDSFGSGLANDPAMSNDVWATISSAWVKIPLSDQNSTVIRGFVTAVAQRDRALAERFIEQCTSEPPLASLLAPAQAAVGLDLAGIARLDAAFDTGIFPVAQWHFLSRAAVTSGEVKQQAAALLAKVAKAPGGYVEAVQALGPWITVAEQDGHSALMTLQPLCLEVLTHAHFSAATKHLDYSVGRIADIALSDQSGKPVAASLAGKMLAAGVDDAMVSYQNDEVLRSLLRHQLEATLTTFFQGTDREHSVVREIFNDLAQHRTPSDDQIETGRLVSWCSEDPEKRFSFALDIIPLLTQHDGSPKAGLTAQTLALIVNAPDPEKAITQVAGRLEPSSWSGSRAALIAHNATALNELFDRLDVKHHDAIRRAQDSLEVVAREELSYETSRERNEDERFE